MYESVSQSTNQSVTEPVNHRTSQSSQLPPPFRPPPSPNSRFLSPQRHRHPQALFEHTVVEESNFAREHRRNASNTKGYHRRQQTRSRKGSTETGYGAQQALFRSQREIFFLSGITTEHRWYRRRNHAPLRCFVLLRRYLQRF